MRLGLQELAPTGEALAFCISLLSMQTPRLHDDRLRRAATREMRRTRWARCRETGTFLRPPDQCVSSVDHREKKLLWISVREQCELLSVSNEIVLITLVVS